MDNFLLASIRELAGTTLAFSNGWRWGAPVLPGPVTENDVWNIVPWPVPISTADLTGRELIEMLEENLERTYSAKPFDQQGGYVKRCHGMKMFIKIENPPGTRIQDLFIAGERVQPNKTYSTAFLTVQAVPEKYGKNRKNLTQTAHDAILAYLAEHKPASAELVGSVVAN